MSAAHVWRARAQKLAQRIDAMSLRERIFLFLSSAAMLLALVDTSWMAPLRKERDAQVAAQKQQAQDLQALRNQFTQNALGELDAQGESPAALLRQRIDTARSELASLRQVLLSGHDSASKGPGLADLLGTLLKQHERLSLSKLSTIDGGPPEAQGIVLEGLQWQGVELQLSGEYRDQIAYLHHLEQAVPGLHWGELRLWSQGQPRSSLLQVQLFLLKSNP